MPGCCVDFLAPPRVAGSVMSAPLLRALVICAALVCGATTRAQTVPSDPRLAAATALTFGRLPLPGEALADAAAPFATWLAAARARLQTDPVLRRTTAVHAWADTFGVTPTDRELADDTTDALTYTALVERHLAWLAARPDAYRAVLDRAYQRVVHRPAFDEEVGYWHSHLDRPLSYILLVGCLDNWARRNQPGLMATTGTPTVSPHTRALDIVRVPPDLIADMRAAAALPAAGSPALARAAGRNLLAPGGARLVTAGGIPFIAVGASPTAPF